MKAQFLRSISAKGERPGNLQSSDLSSENSPIDWCVEVGLADINNADFHILLVDYSEHEHCQLEFDGLCCRLIVVPRSLSTSTDHHARLVLHSLTISVLIVRTISEGKTVAPWGTDSGGTSSRAFFS